MRLRDNEVPAAFTPATVFSPAYKRPFFGDARPCGNRAGTRVFKDRWPQVALCEEDITALRVDLHTLMVAPFREGWKVVIVGGSSG